MNIVTERQILLAKEWAEVYTETVRFLEGQEFEIEEENYKGEVVKRSQLGFDTTKEVAALILVQLMEKADENNA